MLGQVLGVNQDVVHVYADNTLVDHIPEDLIHHCLKCCRRVGQAEKHHQRFKQASVGLERSLSLISLLNPYVVVAPTDIHLGEDLGA